MHFSSQRSKHPLTLKTAPPPIVKDRWGGSGEGQGRKGLPAQCLTMVQDKTNKSWSKRCLRYMAMIKNQTQPLWVHCSDTKKKKKNLPHRFIGILDSSSFIIIIIL